MKMKYGKKKKRKRKEHWFGRRQRSRWKNNTTTVEKVTVGKKRRKELWLGRRQRSRWKKGNTTTDRRITGSNEDEWDRSWKHEFEYNFAPQFDCLCEKNKDIIDIIVGKNIVNFKNTFSTIHDFGYLDLETSLSEDRDCDEVKPSLLKDGIRFQSAFVVDSDDMPVVFDTGASISVSPRKDDFISWEQYGDNNNIQLNGITASTRVCGIGTIRWTLYDDEGRRHDIETKGYYVPDARVRLFSPQRLLHERKSGKFMMTPDGGVFTFPGKEKRHRITFRLWQNGPKTALPMAYVVPRMTQQESTFDETFALLNVLDEANVNLTSGQKELMSWHFRLGHFHLAWIQKLFRVTEGDSEGVLPTKHKANSCVLPQCAACHFAKMHLRPTEATTQTIRPEKDGVLKTGHLKPGEMVSTDQYVSKQLGRLPHTRGKESANEKYQGGTIFVDEASGFIFIQHQVGLTASETIRSKHLFERESASCGVLIQNYRGDNGVYKTKEFMDDLEQRNQTMRFSGVGAHHQNGIAERAIRTISESARAMILHAAIHWPEEISLELWPFAMDYAVYLWNRMPRKETGLSPIEIFCGSKIDRSVLRNAHVWGCPSYVLDPAIQDGRKLPRWQPKSRRGQFLGFSKRHSSTIGLIRNVRTNAISPQFHVVFDDAFSTVPSRVNDDDIKPPDNWTDLLTFSRMNVYDGDEDDVPTLDEEWLTEQEIEARNRQKNQFKRNQTIQPVVRSVEPIREDPEEQLIENENDDDSNDPVQEWMNNDDDDDDDDDNDDDEYYDYWRPREAKRQWIPNRRYFNENYDSTTKLNRNEGLDALINDFGVLSEDEAFLATLGIDEKEITTSQLKQIEVLNSIAMDEDGLLTSIHPLAFAAKANNDDSPNFYQAMNGPDAEGYYEAMVKELEQLETKDPWELVRIEDLPEDVNILDSTWVFKRKRTPDGQVKKLKARFCVRGDQQIEGIDFFDTYAPVVSWSTVRLLLILSVLLGLATKQVDYTLAFVHADLKDDVYVRMPRMFERPGYIYKLKKSLYGLRQAPLNFFLYLKEGLEARGFKQSTYDPCLFVSEKVICLCYVDDCLFFAKDDADIENVIDSLQRPEPTKFDLTIEDDVAGFLGILMHKREDGSIELQQTGLIDRILKIMGLTDARERSTPADVKSLGKDENGEPCSEPWSYASVVGMMMYLASNSRPDIAFAVHSCARFTHCARRIHEKGLKRIARYLKGTRTKGMLIKPSSNLALDLYADADFAGLWGAENSTDPTSAKSRTGYLITLGEVPVLWTSKLQTEISLSTCEAEYIALSTAMKALLPIRLLFHSLADTLEIAREELTKVCAVYEDNNAALKLATAQFPNMTPRTKHIAIKYHWFKEHLVDGEIEMRPIDTKLQKADIFTKGLSKREFEEKRKMVMGW
jgi:hypothetical protein